MLAKNFPKMMILTVNMSPNPTPTRSPNPTRKPVNDGASPHDHAQERKNPTAAVTDPRIDTVQKPKVLHRKGIMGPTQEKYFY